MDTLHLLWFGLPLLSVVAGVLRRRGRSRAGLIHPLRDVVTLRMVLRDSTPGQRARLLAAHRQWRTDRGRASR